MLGFQGEISSPAEAAIGLQRLASDGVTDVYDYRIDGDELGFAPMFAGIIADRATGRDAGVIAAMFHNTLAAGTVAMCDSIRSAGGPGAVVLSGGVFYNSLLNAAVVAGLQDQGFAVYGHRLLAPGDVSVSFGQAVVASMQE